ncbi:hypothetical protein [Catenibacterium sp.]|uniref:hypothetical protein n=1 Tax=Catenibacterium sp. TaxID=2049022 RepID=UPI002E778668|nr:hypothetical protein [Catenibacterium sp.]MEE0040970.1 hypothetical protein [Catenibacterium sp.]
MPESDTHAYSVLGSAEMHLTAGKATKSVYLKGLTFTPDGNVLSVGTGTMIASRFQGTANKANADGRGNNIVDTYQTKAGFNSFKNEFKELTNAEIDNLWATAP